MKASLSFDFDPDNKNEVERIKNIIDMLGMSYDMLKKEFQASDFENAWKQCSWEIITLAVTVLKIHDGESDKGIYAFYDNLCNPDFHQSCDHLTDRIISARVGRTAVICKKMGGLRLMEVAVRRKDKVKRVYVAPDAREALLNLLRHSDWGKDFNTYLMDNNLVIPDYSSL